MAGAKLSDMQVKKITGKDKPFKLADGGGLYLYVTPAGGKFWRWQFRFEDKAQLVSIGEYPEVSLEDARIEHQRWQRILRGGINPAVAKKKEKRAEAISVKLDKEHSTIAQMKPFDTSFPDRKVDWPAGSFGAVQAEWFEGTFKHGKSTGYQDRVASKLTDDILPKLGRMHIRDIGARDVVQMAKAIEERGAGSIARNALMITNQIFRFAFAHGYVERNPVADFKPSDVLKEMKPTNFARIEKEDLPALLVAMHNYTGTRITWFALQIMARVFLRTGELRGGMWAEIDLEKGRWDIPGERMKNGLPHIVPLSRQVKAMFRELREITRDDKYVFPGAVRREKCLSSNTILAALERMHYRGVMTGHGFRGVASTILREGEKRSSFLRAEGYNRDWVEMQLAHTVQDKTEGAYNKAKYLDARTTMMQDWSDYLDEQLLAAKNTA